ncbi:MAG: hypothetical protein AAFY48_07325 [Bacteroidota bacterium]
MRIQKNWFLALLMILPVMLIFFSCEKEATTTVEEEMTTEEFTVQALVMMEESGEMGCGGCFTLVYPVTIILPDESEEMVFSREEIGDAIRAYLEANPPQNDRPFRPLRGFRPEIAMPYDVQLEDGAILTIESREDLGIVLEDCGFEPNRPWRPGDWGNHGQHGGLNRCFNIVFPITLAFPDGTEVTVENRAELRLAIRTWRAENPGVEGRPTLAYPYDVELQDGTVLTIASDEDRADLREVCEGTVGDGHGRRCFRISYPIDINFPDGTSVSVDNREEALTAIMEWVEANPDATERPQIDFPIEVTLRNGETVTVETREQLRRLRRICRG